MSETTYLNFDLIVKRRNERQYRVEVESTCGQPRRDFDWPFSLEDMTVFRQVLEGPARDARRTDAERRVSEGNWRNKVKIFGEELFETIFTDDVRASFMKCLDAADRQGGGLRIRVRTDDAPELADVPWEYLYSRSLQRYFALDEQTPIVRYMAVPTAPVALQVETPLNILIMLSAPQGYPRLAVDDEWQKIQGAFRDLSATNQVSVDRVPRATPDALQEQLRNKHYHVFHFIGHGDFDPSTNEASLIMEKANGQGEFVGDEYVKVLLNHRYLRLVILNSCEGARASPLNPFSGIAQSLVQRIPAVIAMQFKITDKAAIQFTNKFYKALADGDPIDTSLVNARKAIYLDHNPTEWGTPVLFMHAPDGHIFRVERPTEEKLRQAQIDTLLNDTTTYIQRKEYSLAIEKLQRIVELQRPAGMPT